jgi:hypothetical protein
LEDASPLFAGDICRVKANNTIKEQTLKGSILFVAIANPFSL